MRYTALAVLMILGASVAAQAQDKAVERGMKVFAEQKCTMCHSIAGKGNAKGPLDNVGAKLSEEEIRQWMTAPKVMAEKTKSTRKPMMPDYNKLSKEDLDAVIAYMRSLKKG